MGSWRKLILVFFFVGFVGIASGENQQQGVNVKVNDLRPSGSAPINRKAAFGVPMDNVFFNPSQSEIVQVYLKSKLNQILTEQNIQSKEDFVCDIIEFGVNTKTSLLYWDVIGRIHLTLKHEGKSYDLIGTNKTRTYVWPGATVITQVVNKSFDQIGAEVDLLMGNKSTKSSTLLPIFNIVSSDPKKLISNDSKIEMPNVVPVFDDRLWQMNGSLVENGKLNMIGYTLSGETVGHWTELVSIFFNRGVEKEYTLKKYVDATNANNRSKCPNMTWQSLYQSDDEYIWKASVQACKGQEDQSEIERVLKVNGGFLTYSYAIKKSPLPEDKEKVWLENLKAFKIK